MKLGSSWRCGLAIVSLAGAAAAFMGGIPGCNSPLQDLAPFHELRIYMSGTSAGKGKGTFVVTVEGQVKCTGDNMNPCKVNIDKGKVANVTATPNPDSEIDRWQDGSLSDRGIIGCVGTAPTVNLSPYATSECTVHLRERSTSSTDAGTDAGDDGSTGAAAAGGMLRATVSKTGVYVEGLLDLTEADLGAMTAPDDYVYAAAGLAPGKCSAGPWNVPMKPNPNKVGQDLGPIALKDGAMTVADMTFSAGRYTCNANTPVFGKVLDLAAMDTNKLPSLVAGLLAPASGPIEIVEPAGPVVMTRGQPFTFKWTPFTADTFVFTVAGSPPVCRLDPKTGTFEIPADITAMFEPGSFKTFLFQQMTRRTVPAKINGVARSLRGYALSVAVANGDVQ